MGQSCQNPLQDATEKGTPYILPSGEVCVKIPNSVIESNRKSWDFFVLGQFYSDPPSKGTLHNIVNGIWSKHYKDISVSKLDGNAFLFRIPNASTRNHVIAQRLWQIEGQTMFVTKWEPGVIPKKPELSSAPIWLELQNVPLQFFNEEGLEYVAGLVGEPKFLHPSTANKTNLEVARVFTIIDPGKPLPEAVNVQFASGEIARVLVSSPRMPPVCSHCKGIGNTIKRCSSAPITCPTCKSTTHSPESCPRLKEPNAKRRQQKKHPKPQPNQGTPLPGQGAKMGEPSGLSVQSKVTNTHSSDGTVSEVEADSSDTFSSDSGGACGDEYDEKFQVALSKRKRKVHHRSGFKKWIRGTKSLFGGLIETHVKQEKMKKFVNNLLPGWCFDENYGFSDLGKIWIMWDPSVQVVVLSKSLQMVTSEVLLPEAKDKIIVSIIYASNDEGQRKELWAELVSITNSQLMLNKPWIVLGDFNQTLNPDEHSSPATLNVDPKTRDFRDCLLEADLSDMTFKGSTFTWWNKSKTRLIAKKLDRVLVNSHWFTVYPASFAVFGEPGFSDHASCGVTLDTGTIKEKRPFSVLQLPPSKPILSSACGGQLVFL
ncbi:PREDICTED: uncharacterized protein LOC104784120 [Camelina sativa]|uniref:Uncharacterized protein LOC104784120 n=1 Tax=Camelina sativa TaxID=90675 RepID=A0ABM0YXK5_CAMSA|nr:PREDICTED: uncharacterized protein LOC104784120 [Camelina sativa]